MSQLRTVLQQQGASLVQELPLYLRASVPARGGGAQILEFLLSDDDSTVSLRGVVESAAGSSVTASVGGAYFGGAVSRGGLYGKFEKLRLALRWQDVYVLRNRKRVFGVVESPFDRFGDVPPLDVNYGRTLDEQ